MTGWTLDAPAPGLVVAQPTRGFRYGAEAFWLAGFALEGGPARTALDVGTGSGIVARLLARAGLDVVGVDAWPGWAEGWGRSSGEGAGRLTLVRADVRALPGADRYDLVVSNPPFYPRGEPEPVDESRRAARFETQGTVRELAAAAAAHVAPGGRLCVVVPVARRDDVVAGAAPLVVAREVRVGTRRVLLELREVGAPTEPAREVSDRGADVAAWYERASGAPPRG